MSTDAIPLMTASDARAIMPNVRLNLNGEIVVAKAQARYQRTAEVAYKEYCGIYTWQAIADAFNDEKPLETTQEVEQDLTPMKEWSHKWVYPPKQTNSN